MTYTHASYLEVPQNCDELLAAGVPEAYLPLISRATGAFWESYANQFPEVTSGDSQMCDEPGNAIAMWLCQGTGVAFEPKRLCFIEETMSTSWVGGERMVQVLANCIKSARESVVSELPHLRAPSVQVMDYLYNTMDHVLYWNFPRPPDDEEDDDPGEDETSGATGSDSIQ